MSNTKLPWLYVAIGLLLTANIVTLTMLWFHKEAQGQQQQGGFRPQQGQLFDYLTAELKLDEKQKAAYAALRDEHHALAEKLQDSLRLSKDAFFNMLKQNTADKDSVANAANTAAAVQQRLDVITFYHFQKVRALCNAVQQKKFDEIIQDALRRKGPQGPPPGDGPPPPRR